MLSQEPNQPSTEVCVNLIPPGDPVYINREKLEVTLQFGCNTNNFATEGFPVEEENSVVNLLQTFNLSEVESWYNCSDDSFNCTLQYPQNYLSITDVTEFGVEEEFSESNINLYIVADKQSGDFQLGENFNLNIKKVFFFIALLTCFLDIKTLFEDSTVHRQVVLMTILIKLRTLTLMRFKMVFFILLLLSAVFTSVEGAEQNASEYIHRNYVTPRIRLYSTEASSLNDLNTLGLNESCHNFPEQEVADCHPRAEGIYQLDRYPQGYFMERSSWSRHGPSGINLISRRKRQRISTRPLSAPNLCTIPLDRQISRNLVDLCVRERSLPILALPEGVDNDTMMKTPCTNVNQVHNSSGIGTSLPFSFVPLPTGRINSIAAESIVNSLSMDSNIGSMATIHSENGPGTVVIALRYGRERAEPFIENADELLGNVVERVKEKIPGFLESFGMSRLVPTILELRETGQHSTNVEDIQHTQLQQPVRRNRVFEITICGAAGN